MRDSISLLEKIHAYGTIDEASVETILATGSENIIDQFLISLIEEKSKIKTLSIIQKMTDENYDIQTLTQKILEKLRQKLIHTEDTTMIKNLIAIVEYFEESFTQSKFSIIPQLPLELATFKSLLFLGYQGASQ